MKHPAIPTAKPVKVTRPTQPRMPALKLPTMKTGGMKQAAANIAAVHGSAKPAPPRAYSSAISKAASTSSPTATSPGNGTNGWRNQGKTKRPQQDSPLGFFNQ